MPADRKYPRRTLLLMVLGLVAFARLWCATHPRAPSSQEQAPREGPTPVQVVPLPPTSDGGTAP